MHLTFESLPQNPQHSEAISVARASHHETKCVGKDAKARFNSRFVDLILCLRGRVGQYWATTRLRPGHNLKFLPQEFDLAQDQSLRAFTTSASELEADT